MKIVCAIVIVCALAGCSAKIEVLKSPCAGNEGSPCGPKRPVNDWWQNQKDSA